MISASTFKLPPSLVNRLRQVADHLYEGLGFQIIHGLDPKMYTGRQNTILFAGISANICPVRGYSDYSHERVICKSAATFDRHLTSMTLMR